MPQQHSQHYRVVVSSGYTDAGQPFVGLKIGRPGAFNHFEIPLGAAHALGVEIVGTVDGLLAASSRPWDGDPGRTPYPSRSYSRAGARSATGAPAGARA